MPNRRHFLQTLGAAALIGAVSPAHAAARAPRILMLLYRGETEVERGFRAYFAERGVAVDYIVRDVAQDLRRLPELIAEARALRPDLVYTWGTPVTLGVVGRQGEADPTRHLTDIPVLFTMVAAPEESGLVRTRATSGRLLTGTSHVVPIAQQLNAIRAYRPLTRLAAIYNPAEPNAALAVAALRSAAGRDPPFALLELPLPLDSARMPVVAALPELIAKAVSGGAQFLYMGPDSFLAANRATFTATALAAGLPTFAATEIALRDGDALFGLVSRYESVGRLTALKAEQILIGRLRPQDIPIDTLSRFSYIVNMRVAERLALYPPLKVLNYAEIVR